MREALSTKTKILNASIELFSKKGFDNCGIREIASAVNIKSSGIYNYFTSKEQILENIFMIFEEEYRKFRIPTDELIEMAKIRPLIEVFEKTLYIFNTEDEYCQNKKIFKILVSKLYQCNVAKLYHKIYIEESTQYIDELMKNLIKINKIKEQNYESISYMINSFYFTIKQELYLKPYSFEEANRRLIHMRNYILEIWIGALTMTI